MYPDKFEFHVDYFDKIMGNSDIRLALESGQSPEQNRQRAPGGY